MHARDDVGTTMIVAMTVRMGVFQQLCSCRRIQEEVAIQSQQAAVAHPYATKEEHAGYPEGPQAFNLAEASREFVRRGLDAPRNSCKRQNVGCKVGDTVDSICNHCFGIEGVTTNALCNGHAKIRKQPKSRNADTSIVLVLRGQIAVVVVVVMAMVTAMASGLGRAHDGERTGAPAVDFQ